MPNHLIYSDTPKEAESYVVARTSRDSGQAVLFITPSDRDMDIAIQQLEVFAKGAIILPFPAWDCLPYDRNSPKHSLMAQRLSTLSTLISSSCGLTTGSHAVEGDTGVKHQYDGGKNFGKRIIIVSTVNAVTQKLPPRSTIEHATLSLTEGNELDRDALLRYLVANGYTRVSKVMEAGEFAIRGDIIDLFPSGFEQGCRIDLFGDTIESIQGFNPLTQRSDKQKISTITLHPVSEVLMDDASVERFRNRYRDQFGAINKPNLLYNAISEGHTHLGMEHYLPLFYESLDTLYDYLPDDAISVFSYLSEMALQDRQEVVEDYYTARKELGTGDSDAVYHPLPPTQLYLLDKQWEGVLETRDTIKLSPFADANGLSQEIRVGREFSSERKQGKNPFELAAEYLGMHPNKKVLIATVSQGSAESLKEKLFKNHSPLAGESKRAQPDWVGGEVESRVQSPEFSESPPTKSSGEDLTPPQGGSVRCETFPLSRGFITADSVVLSEQDILGERRVQKRNKRKSSEQFFAEVANFSEGELVVHREHGVGRFEGLETMEAGGIRHDCLKLVYAENARLFLPVENIDLISRYGDLGEEDATALLDKLGGGSWQARKARLKERIKLAAEELLRVAASRNLAKAPTLTLPEGLYEEFCNRFAFVETEDQQSAIDDVLDDLTKGHPADRLICGDVGYGKTEVAMRAAFVAATAEEGRAQVALIAPTTLLVRQHYQSFKERFAGFPVEIRQLSRLVSSKDAAQTREDIKQGKVDIVIGTHALLADSVSFKNLGLLIVDEEQHFGVKQKEKLKKLRSNIHVITLSATPIPRTMQMALTGVRDLSLITTPPVDRLAVRTFVSPFDPVMVREALLREYHRGGQSFYVTPYVKDIAELRKRITDLVPEIKIVTAHGQIAAGELDKVMNEFYDGKFDVLMSTSIIESGIDVPTANTLIVNRSDRFGLSQLYQLRGRVGRSKTRAYAYLTLPHHKHFTSNAMRRLEVMQTLDTLGAGFSVASHDMDIRGFGNLVGEEQSGHIREVGVELYQHMLEEAVQKIRKEKQTSDETDESQEWRPQIKLGLSVLIPEDYITDLDLRLGLYRRAATLKTNAEIDDFAMELTDRFGKMPEVTEHFLETLKLKLLCVQANIERVDSGPKGVVVTFRENKVKNPQALLEFISKHKSQMKIRPDQKLVIAYNAAQKDTSRRVAGLVKIITTIAAFSNKEEVKAA